MNLLDYYEGVARSMKIGGSPGMVISCDDMIQLISAARSAGKQTGSKQTEDAADIISEQAARIAELEAEVAALKAHINN